MHIHISPFSRRGASRVGLGILAGILVLCGHSRTAETPASTPLRLGVLPDLDSLPMVVAETEGHFARAKLRVELVSAASAAERDQLLQAGRIDGMVTDPVALVLYYNAGLPVVAVRHSMVPMPGRPQFRVLTAPGANLRTAQDLKNVPIASSEGTIAEYAARRALAAAGLAPNEISVLAVPALATRLTLLVEGKVRAAVLPEPFATQAALAGATGVVDRIDHRPFCCSVIAFRREILETRRPEVHALLQALDQAAAAINADKPRYARVAAERKLMPPACAASLELMDYPQASVPDRALIDGVVQWLSAKGRLTRRPDYGDIVQAQANAADDGAARP